MNPKPMGAVACSQCGALYRDHEQGQKAAESCCRCVHCNKPSATYTGQGGVCKTCLTIEALRAARESHRQTGETLAKLEEQAKKLKIEEVAEA